MTSSTPRVAIVAASLDILGGQGVQARSLVDGLTSDGQPVTFIPIDQPFPPALRGLRAVRGIRTLVNQALYLPRLLALATVDVAHVFSASYASFLLAPLPAMLIARAMNKQVVLHYHSGEADDHLSRWGVLVHPWLRLAHHIVVPSEYLREVFARHGYQVRVIPNVVDLTRFAYRERRPLRPRLLSTRNLERYYRVDVIVRAYARVKASFPDASLTIAGYGSEERRLRALVADHHLADVRFAGKVAPAAMPDLLDEADIYLNASEVDNQPVSILEAFAAGLPVVSTGAGDIPAMVRHDETGLIVPPDDPDAIADAVIAILRNEERALGFAREAHDVVRRFTWPEVRQAWADVYQRRDRHGVLQSWTSRAH